jgi:hypothetical protein
MPELIDTSARALTVEQGAETLGPAAVMEFYHQRIFYYFGDKYPQRIREWLFSKPLNLRKKAFLPRFERDRLYEGEAAWKICESYLNSIESELNNILRNHSVFYWLHLYRRIGVFLSPDHGDKTDANTVALVRHIAELGISKYGNLERADDVALSSKIHFKDVLGGHYKRLWTKWVGAAEAKARFHDLAQSTQWVLVDFCLKDLFAVYGVEGLSYEYWRVTALMRAIGKGARIRLIDEDWPTYPSVGPFANLIASYDDRIAKTRFSSALVGSWFHIATNLKDRGTAMLLTIYNSEGRDQSAFVSELLGSGRGAPSYKSNFLVTQFDIKPFKDAHLFLADAFKKATGTTLDSYLLCLWALSNVGFFPARVLFGSGGGEKTDAAFSRRFALNLINMMQRSYLAFDNDWSALVDEIIFRISNFSESGFSCERSDVESCMNQLLLTENSRDSISLWSGGRRFPLVKFANAIVIDVEGIPAILRSLFYRIQYEQSDRGSIFEEAFRRALTSERFTTDKYGEIVNGSGEKREIDASVRIGNTLIIFECRSIERPLDFELGRPTTMRARREFLEKKVDQALSLRDFVLDDLAGRNYDFSWATSVSVFVVSPFVEWVWDLSPRLWHDAQVPRILQADEAISYLHRLSKSHRH